MKYLCLTTGLIFLISTLACSNGKKKIEIQNITCLPGTVLFVCLGRDDKPKWALSIRTNEMDSSIFSYIGSEKQKLEKNGFLISKEVLRVSIVTPETYQLLKGYIVGHNTHKDATVFTATAATIKIILSDRCGSVKYTIEKIDVGYFSNMLNTLNLKKDDVLGDLINYYQNVQNDITN